MMMTLRAAPRMVSALLFVTAFAGCTTPGGTVAEPLPPAPATGSTSSPVAANAKAAPATCSARPARSCDCASPEACGSMLKGQLKDAIDACFKVQWSCDRLELHFDSSGCALPTAAGTRPRFVECLQRELDSQRWPCLAAKEASLYLGSCTVL
jgi:hypothetical protein